MWRTYFSKAHIFGLDFFDKSAHDGHRIRTLRGSQASATDLDRLASTIGRLQVIIDDGGPKRGCASLF